MIDIPKLMAALPDEQREEIARLCIAGIAAESERRDNGFWTDTASEQEWIAAMVEGLRMNAPEEPTDHVEAFMDRLAEPFDATMQEEYIFTLEKALRAHLRVATEMASALSRLLTPRASFNEPSPGWREQDTAQAFAQAGAALVAWRELQGDVD